jgi:hypothetical protein
VRICEKMRTCSAGRTRVRGCHVCMYSPYIPGAWPIPPTYPGAPVKHFFKKKCPNTGGARSCATQCPNTGGARSCATQCPYTVRGAQGLAQEPTGARSCAPGVRQLLASVMSTTYWRQVWARERDTFMRVAGNPMYFPCTSGCSGVVYNHTTCLPNELRDPHIATTHEHPRGH